MTPLVDWAHLFLSDGWDGRFIFESLRIHPCPVGGPYPLSMVGCLN